MNKRTIGSTKENLAKDHLLKLGYKIIERNFFTRAGEIDLIALEGGYLVFVEVKYRFNTNCGDPTEAVNIKKQRKIVQCARYYMLTHGYSEDTPCRFDVVVLLKDEIRVIPNAYDAW